MVTIGEVPSARELFDLSGKVALVTGATGAFGEVAAKTLAKAGARVVLNARNEENLRRLATDMTGAGCTVAIAAGDVASYEDVKRIVDAAVNAFGGIDILVTAAGINKPAPITEQPPEEWQQIMDVNVRGTWLVCKEVGKVMVARGQGGKVILVSSTRGMLGMANYSAYSPSKAAINLLTKSLACEWGPYRINVNAIAPTVFRSALTQWMFGDSAVYQSFVRRIPLGRLGECLDFVGPILFLASRASDFMTGCIVYVDGGYTAC